MKKRTPKDWRRLVAKYERGIESRREFCERRALSMSTLVNASPVSCGHRASNACGQHKAAEWEARQKARLLPVPYHMVTFTSPSEFREFFGSHQKLCYDLFFRESAGALADLAAVPKLLGGEIGMTSVLQTGTRDLRYQPHIHYLVLAGVLTATG